MSDRSTRKLRGGKTRVLSLDIYIAQVCRGSCVREAEIKKEEKKTFAVSGVEADA